MVARRIVCLAHEKTHRAHVLAAAMAAGIAQAGDVPTLAETWDGSASYDAVVAYGWRYWQPCFAAYAAAGKPYVFIDGGYWGREKSAEVETAFHKVTVNCRHPFVRLDLPEDRFARFGLEVAPWRAGGNHILLAGMSAKNAADMRVQPEHWERGIVSRLRKLTGRPIVYRPKPTWPGANRTLADRFSPPSEPLADVLRDCHAVVTHHSNVGVDALLAGVPIFTEDGAARPFSTENLEAIETPARPDGRERFMAGLAYCQWSLAEMRSGVCWKFVREEAFGG